MYKNEFEILASLIIGILVLKRVYMNKLLIILFVFIISIRQIVVLNANNETYINTTNIIYDEENNIIELAENSKINIRNTNILVIEVS